MRKLLTKRLALLVTMVAFGPLILASGVWGEAHVALPFEEEGALDGAPFRIRVPADWNGTLLVYTHGYWDKADHPGEVDYRTPWVVLVNRLSLEELLLTQGYALAGSAYKENGWAVKEGTQNTLALTNYFRGRVGNPLRTVIWGNSLGGAITLANMEKYPGIYDGAIPLCTFGAGAPRALDAIFVAFGLAYDVSFGWPASWGEVEDVRDDLDFQTEVFPIVLGQVLDPANFGRFEFIRLVNDLPLQDFYSGFNWLFRVMNFMTEARAELERRALGPVGQNLDHFYSLTSEEKDYLGSLGVDADAMLAEMNARTDIVADPQSRNYVERYVEFTGRITRPVINLHTRGDGIVPTFHQTALRETMQEAGSSDLLVQAVTDSVGHCRFSDAQILTAVQAMDAWIETGERPGPDAFPALLGFVPGYVPPPFPYSYP